MPRILLAGLFHEGNSFSSLVTDRESFAVTRGPALLEKARVSGAGMGGAYRRLVELGAQLEPFASAVAPPGGPVANSVYRAFRDNLLDAARSVEIDGVYLDLHGAMVTETLDDPEGDLLGSLRSALGPAVPIAVSLDLHAHLTPAMLGHADSVVACKENPHTDYDVAGAKAAELLMAQLRGEARPVTAALWLPLIIGSQMETAQGPLARLHAQRRRLLAETENLLDISIYNTTTLLDVEGGGQCITAIADDDAEAARQVVVSLARGLWGMRDDFTPDLPPLTEVLETVETGRLARPVILGDQGDRVLAGTPGDGTLVARELLANWPGLRALVPVTDPATVAAAKEAGIGATLTDAVGGGLSRGVQALEGRWSIEKLGDGHFVHEGPFLANEPSELGDIAILTQGNLTLLVTSLPGFTQDPAAFRSQGIEPGDFDVVVVKSGHHFKLSFETVGPCVVVDTPGLSNYRPGLLPFRKRRPVHPEDRVAEPAFQVTVF